MQELLVPLFEYLRGIWRYRWVALITAAVVCVAGWVWVDQLPERYVAKARVNIDTNSVLRPMLRGLAIQPNVGQRVALLSKTLLSRPNLEKIMRMTDLDLQAETESEKEALLAMLGKNIRLVGDRRNRSLYSVSFVHEDRDTAKRVVQAVLTVFVENILGEKRVESEGAQEFLDKQIAEYEKRLEAAEKRLADFKREHVGNMPDDRGGYYQKLQQAQAALSGAELKLRELENRRAELLKQLEEQTPQLTLETYTAEEISPLDARIQSLKAKLDSLLVKYTEKHPEVRQIKGLIAELEKQKQENIEQAPDRVQASDQYSAAVQTNPIYQQLKSLLANTESEIAALKVRVVEYRQRVQSLANKIDNIPKIEAQLKQLNRDYKIVAQQHAALLKQREKARLGEKAGQETDDVKFKVIDPPFVPLRATEPNKLLLNTLVLLAGIGAGIGVALLLTLLRPVYRSRHRLEMHTGLPVLGVVTKVTTAVERRKALLGNLAFVGLAVLLLVIFGALMMHQAGGLDVLGKLKELRGHLQ